MPESVRFLAAKTGRSAEIAAILRKADPQRSFPADTEFVLAAEPKKKGFRPTQLFTEGRAATTILLWFIFLVTLASLNTLNNWLPLALNMAGLPEQQAVRLTTLFQFGGIAGCSRSAYSPTALGYPRVLILAFIGLAMFVAATGLMGDYALGLAIVVAGTGFCLVGANNTLNAFATTLYPTEIRATGAGWASSFGRFMGGFGPIIGGILLHELPLRTVFFIFAIPAIGGALGVLALGPRASGNRAFCSNESGRPRMNNPSIPVSWGELIDKITILEIKSERLTSKPALENVRRELSQLSPLSRARRKGLEPKLVPLRAELKRVNETLWQIEDDIRAKEAERKPSMRISSRWRAPSTTTTTNAAG